MGYTLTIGELSTEYDNKVEDWPHCGVSAKGFEHDDAPAFGEPTDRQSSRWPSYTAWANSMEFVGLDNLFFGKDRDDALIESAGHPGCIPLTEKHRREINAALEAFKIKYPDAKPTYGKPCPDDLKGVERMMYSDESNPEENGYMCRLVWLHYWVNWVLDNREQPVFANS